MISWYCDEILVLFISLSFMSYNRAVSSKITLPAGSLQKHNNKWRVIISNNPLGTGFIQQLGYSADVISNGCFYFHKLFANHYIEWMWPTIRTVISSGKGVLMLAARACHLSANSQPSSAVRQNYQSTIMTIGSIVIVRHQKTWIDFPWPTPYNMEHQAFRASIGPIPAWYIRVQRHVFVFSVILGISWPISPIRLPLKRIMQSALALWRSLPQVFSRWWCTNPARRKSLGSHGS